MASILRASNGATAVADKYGEGWGEYYSELMGACFQFCNRQAFLDEMLRTERSDRIEVRGDAVRGLGQIVLPNQGFSDPQRAVIEKRLLLDARDDNPDIRGASVRLLGDLAHADARLPSPVRLQIHEAVVTAATDRSPAVRQQAARTLGDIGDAADLPVLQRLAETDTAQSVSHGNTVFPVRDQARRAIGKIKPK